MAEHMNDLQLMIQEKQNTGTAWTRNEKFEKDGYLVVKDLWNPEELYHPVPEHPGQYTYSTNDPQRYSLDPVEAQVGDLLLDTGIHSTVLFIPVFV